MKMVSCFTILFVSFLPFSFSLSTNKSVSSKKCPTNNYVEYDEKLCLGVLYFRNRKVFNHSNAESRCSVDEAVLIRFSSSRMEFLILNRFLHKKYLNKVVEESRMNCVHFWVGSFAVDAEESDLPGSTGGISVTLCPAVRYCAGQQGVSKVKIPCFPTNSESVVSGVICLQMVDRSKNPLTKKHPTTVTMVAKGSGANLTLDYKARHAENVALNVTDLVDDQDYVSPKVGQEFDANNSSGVMNQQENSATVNNETIQEDDDTVANITILQVSTKKWLVKEKKVGQSKSPDSSEKSLLLATGFLIVGLIVFVSLALIVRSLLKVKKIREYKVAASFCKSEGQTQEEKSGQ